MSLRTACKLFVQTESVSVLSMEEEAGAAGAEVVWTVGSEAVLVAVGRRELQQGRPSEKTEPRVCRSPVLSTCSTCPFNLSA